MRVEHQIIVMLERVRELLGAHPDIMRDYLFYRSELEFQKKLLDKAELKALKKFDRLLLKYRDWIISEVYNSETMVEREEQFDRDHWWWYLDEPINSLRADDPIKG